VLDYLASLEGSAERLALERQYGRRTVQKLVKNYEEERSNSEWLDSSTTTCPGCKVNVQKSEGCNHVCRLGFMFATEAVLKRDGCFVPDYLR
jgi:E3 ubiquitin-protein ligase RNF14